MRTITVFNNITPIRPTRRRQLPAAVDGRLHPNPTCFS